MQEELTPLEQLITIIKTKFSTQPWERGMAQMYAVEIEGLSDDEIKALCKHVNRHVNYRPSPADIISIAAELASPIPNENEVYSTICNTLAFAKGYDDASDFVQNIVAALGGWWHLAYQVEVKYLHSMIEKAYKIEAASWQSNVKYQLTLAPELRDMRYFPIRETCLKLETKPTPLIEGENENT